MIFKRKLKDLSRFDSKNVIFENAELILTRRCNLNCSHCMRGNSQSVDMSTAVMDSFLDKVAEVGNLCIGGGEPALVPELVEVLVEKAKQKGVSFKAVNITTNGTFFSEKFAKALLEIKQYVEQCRQSEYGYDMSEEKPVMLRVSLDDFHLLEAEKRGVSFTNILDNIKKYQEIIGEDCVRASYGCDYDVLKEGRARSVQTDVHKSAVYISKDLYLLETDRSVVFSPLITIGCNGDVIPVNIAFDREGTLSFGNIREEQFSAIMQRFNIKRVEDSDELFDKSLRYMKKISVKQNVVDKYAKSERFLKRRAVEAILQERKQGLKEDYELFEFEPQ